MAQQKLPLPENLPEATILQRLRQVFLTNGYYELESIDLLRFKNYPIRGKDFSPAVVQHELVLSISDGMLFYTYTDLAEEGYKAWEKQYTDLLMQEIIQAVETGETRIIDLPQLERAAAARIFRPTPRWLRPLHMVVTGVAVFLIFWSGNSFDWRFWLACGLILAYALFFRFRYRSERSSASLPSNPAQ